MKAKSLSIRWAAHEAHTQRMGCTLNGGRVWRMKKGLMVALVGCMGEGW
jgi:hypothetical protein